MGSKYAAYKSAALLALAAAVGAGVPFRDEAGHEYHPMPGARKPEGRAHRSGTFTRTGAVPRERHAFIRSQQTPGDGLARRYARWATFARKEA